MTDELETNKIETEDVELDSVDAIDERIDEAVAKALEAQAKYAKKFNMDSTPENKEQLEVADRILESRNFFKAIRSSDRDAIKAISAVRAKAINETTDGEGGYLVPIQFETELLRFANQNTVIRPQATVINMNTDVARLNSLTADVTVYLNGEATTITASTPTFDEPVLTAFKYAGVTEMTSEVEEDAEIEITSVLAERFARAIDKKEQNEFVNGTTAGSLGLLQVTGTTTASVVTAGFAGLTYDKLAEMQRLLFTIDEVEAMEGAFYMSMASYNALRTSKSAGDGNYFILPPVPTQVAPATAWGRPIYVLNEFASPTVTGSKFVVYTNLKKHGFIGDRRGVRVDFTNSDGTNFVKDIKSMKVTKRTAWTTALPTGIVTLSS